MKKINKTAWAITDWDGKLRHPSVSIFDTKKHAVEELKELNALPEPTNKGENKIIKVRITEIK